MLNCLIRGNNIPILLVTSTTCLLFVLLQIFVLMLLQYCYLCPFQTMRGGAEKASWPKAPTACWPLVSLEITTAVADDETTAPTFKDSFSADFDKMLSELSVSKKSASSDSGTISRSCGFSILA